MRQNQYQVNDRTHTTNTPRQDTHGQHWMSVRAMSAHFFTSLHPCLTQSGTYDGVESRGWSDTHSHCSAQFTTLITPNISIERPDAHLADGPTQDVAMANHRPYVRGFTHVFHYVRCFIYTRTTGILKENYLEHRRRRIKRDLEAATKHIEVSCQSLISWTFPSAGRTTQRP